MRENGPAKISALLKVSIIIPAYNEEVYIEATVLAALAQEYSDFEVIVVDNGSLDATAEKVRGLLRDKAGNLMKKVPLTLIQESRAGVQFAREAGRRVATGGLIANLDADCLPPSDWLSKCAAYFGDSRVVAVTGPYDYYDAPLGMRLVSDFSQKIFRYVLQKFLYAFFGLGGLVGGNCVMRADTLAKIGGYDTSIAFHGDDTNTGNRLAKYGKVLFENRLAIGSSARRLKRIGTMKLAWQYMANFFWVLFFNKTYSNTDRGRYEE